MSTRRQRKIFVVLVVLGVASATGLAIKAIGDSMFFFLSPSQVRAGEADPGARVRIGGLVVEGSVRRESGSLDVEFDLTDTAETITVRFSGILPDLFREGQGIVAQGTLGEGGLLEADEVLAKHDENYMPPDVAEAIKAAHEAGVERARASAAAEAAEDTVRY